MDGLFPIKKDERGIRSRALTIRENGSRAVEASRPSGSADAQDLAHASRPELFWPWPAKGAASAPLLETSAGLSLDPWGLAEPPTAAARASEPVIAEPAVGPIRTSGAVPRAPGG